MNEEKEQLKKLEEIAGGVVDVIMQGGTLRQCKGLTDAEMEAIYATGLNAYKVGKLDDAGTVFRYLVLIDHTCAKYWIALGAVQQRLRDFSKAVTSYGYASFLDLEDPKPQYHAAECFLALGDKDSARSALAALEEFAPKDSVYREKAKKLAARLVA